MVFHQLEQLILGFQHAEEAAGLFHIRILGKVEDVAGAAQGELGLAALAVHRVQKFRHTAEHRALCLHVALRFLNQGQRLAQRMTAEPLGQRAADSVERIGIHIVAHADHGIPHDTAIGNDHQ